MVSFSHLSQRGVRRVRDESSLRMRLSVGDVGFVFFGDGDSAGLGQTSGAVAVELPNVRWRTTDSSATLIVRVEGQLIYAALLPSRRVTLPEPLVAEIAALNSDSVRSEVVDLLLEKMESGTPITARQLSDDVARRSVERLRVSIVGFDESVLSLARLYARGIVDLPLTEQTIAFLEATDRTRAACSGLLETEPAVGQFVDTLEEAGTRARSRLSSAATFGQLAASATLLEIGAALREFGRAQADSAEAIRLLNEEAAAARSDRDRLRQDREAAEDLASEREYSFGLVLAVIAVVALYYGALGSNLLPVSQNASGVLGLWLVHLLPIAPIALVLAYYFRRFLPKPQTMKAEDPPHV